jgi:hypothetical protein
MNLAVMASGSSAFAKASADRRSFSGGWSDPDGAV